MKKLILIISLAISVNAFAQDANKTVTLVVSGQGKTQDEAKQVALRSAIEQAFGAFISSKTEILNDSVVADQIASVANGNIQSFSILNESQLLDGSWVVTLKAFVSVSKLSSFVESKGITIEIKGGLFALNIKQQLLNEQGESKAVSEMVGLLHEPMQLSFDYSIKSSDPKSVDAESKNWEIPLVVTATANKNIDFCANYCINTLAAISLSAEEVTSYQGLSKAVFPITILYNGISKTFYLRNPKSLKLLETLGMQWEFYTRLFAVQSGIAESNGRGVGKIHDFYSGKLKPNIGDNSSSYINLSFNYLSTGQQAATFSWHDKLTLSQIEQMTEYKVKPRGVVSQFKYGGFVVYEKDGHGLVVAITDLVSISWNSAKKACEKLILNGYSDWRLPAKEELDSVYVNLYQYSAGGFRSDQSVYYWCSNENELYFAWSQGFYSGLHIGIDKDVHYNYVRAVRTF